MVAWIRILAQFYDISVEVLKINSYPVLSYIIDKNSQEN